VTPAYIRDRALSASIHARAALAALETALGHLTAISTMVGEPVGGFILARRARRLLAVVAGQVDIFARACAKATRIA
jgi:hypothetical protein